MSEIERMRQYTDKTVARMKNREYYALRVSEMYILRELMKIDFWNAFRLVFDYGRAKGYRAAKREARKKAVS